MVSREDYDAALSLARRMITEDPEAPEGYFFLLTALNNRAIDFEDTLGAAELIAAADQVQVICERRIAEGDPTALTYFYLGSSVGFRMIKSLRERDFFDALKFGANAAELLEEAVRLDSTCYDAFTGLGNYYYFQSRYGSILRSVGLIEDRRDLGVALLRKAAERGIMTREAAMSSIAWIWIDKEQPDSAARIAHDLLSRYPDNRAFHWCLARAQKMLKQWEASADTYTKLLNSIRQLPHNNRRNEIGCLHSIALCYSELGRFRDVIRIADEALGIRLTDEQEKHKRKDLSNLRRMREDALEALSNGSPHTSE